MGGVDYDPRTALIVTDVQNDFTDCVQGADGILGLVDAEIRAAREAGAVAVYTQDWHPDQTRPSWRHSSGSTGWRPWWW